jgi:hypothetical protein
MQMICLRSLPCLDTETIAPCRAKEALFRDENGFLLYLSKEGSSSSKEERIIRLQAREVLIWLTRMLSIKVILGLGQHKTRRNGNLK